MGNGHFLRLLDLKYADIFVSTSTCTQIPDVSNINDDTKTCNIQLHDTLSSYSVHIANDLCSSITYGRMVMRPKKCMRFFKRMYIFPGVYNNACFFYVSIIIHLKNNIMSDEIFTFYILSVPKFTAKLYCICLSADLRYT